MCFHIDGSNHVTRMFYNSVVSGVSPDGKPWTKDSVLALEHVLGKNDARTLADLYQFIHEPDAWRKLMVEEYGIVDIATSTNVLMGDGFSAIVRQKTVAKAAEAIESLNLAEFEDVADPVVAGPEDEDDINDDGEETAALPKSLTDLLNVPTNSNQILEAA